ncbi:MAG: bacteriohemerythrin, partial [Rhodospirillales bacterium]|nr:bacteriohemerythrin [Rhodospirillales bacterium]
MSYVTWRDSLLTGIPDIDRDHQTLFDLANQLHDSYAKGVDPSETKEVFAALLDYTDYHFRREEDLLDREGFPDTEAHKQAHEDLKNQVIDLYERYRKGEEGVILDLLAFLSNWLRFHIMEEDMAYK